MYTPNHFQISDDAVVRELIKHNGFATVLSYPLNEKPYINHLPLIFSNKSGSENILIGHMARRNPQWTHFQKNPECTVLIHGPHTYISPRWYFSGRDVPTWNYAAVHLHGKIELMESFDDQVDVLRQLSEYYETSSPTPWDFELPDDLLDPSALTSAIISFKFHIEKTDAKFKLSQNRPLQDKQGVIAGLDRERTDDMSKLIVKMMAGT